mmetsp:Transcript_53604/g.148651  ORF Transcript_53604/g.148651 Transcript_53604/m.148651 type:complete len:213 (+) Transcript_53604:183-821(+)
MGLTGVTAMLASVVGMLGILAPGQGALGLAGGTGLGLRRRPAPAQLRVDHAARPGLQFGCRLAPAHQFVFPRRLGCQLRCWPAPGRLLCITSALRYGLWHGPLPTRCQLQWCACKSGQRLWGFLGGCRRQPRRCAGKCGQRPGRLPGSSRHRPLQERPVRVGEHCRRPRGSSCRLPLRTFSKDGGASPWHRAGLDSLDKRFGWPLPSLHLNL